MPRTKTELRHQVLGTPALMIAIKQGRERVINCGLKGPGPGLRPRGEAGLGWSFPIPCQLRRPRGIGMVQGGDCGRAVIQLAAKGTPTHQFPDVPGAAAFRQIPAPRLRRPPGSARRTTSNSTIAKGDQREQGRAPGIAIHLPAIEKIPAGERRKLPGKRQRAPRSLTTSNRAQAPHRSDRGQVQSPGQKTRQKLRHAPPQTAAWLSSRPCTDRKTFRAQ